MATLLRFLAIALLLWPFAALGQVNVENGGAPVGAGISTPKTEEAGATTDPDVNERLERLKRHNEEKLGSEPAMPESGTAFNTETEAAFQRAWQAYYAYRVDGYSHRQGVFAWQDLSTKIIFVVVIVLVLAGVYFAAVQFHVGLRANQEAADAGEVELSLKGVKVRSPVLGVIVLTISLAFFYLYLIYVYPIEDVF